MATLTIPGYYLNLKLKFQPVPIPNGGPMSVIDYIN